MTKAEMLTLDKEIERLQDLQMEQFTNKKLSSVNKVSTRLKKLMALRDQQKRR